MGGEEGFLEEVTFTLEAREKEVTKVTWAGGEESFRLRARMSEGVVLEPIKALFWLSLFEMKVGGRAQTYKGLQGSRY